MADYKIGDIILVSRYPKDKPLPYNMNIDGDIISIKILNASEKGYLISYEVEHKRHTRWVLRNYLDENYTYIEHLEHGNSTKTAAEKINTDVTVNNNAPMTPTPSLKYKDGDVIVFPITLSGGRERISELCKVYQSELEKKIEGSKILVLPIKNGENYYHPFVISRKGKKEKKVVLDEQPNKITYNDVLDNSPKGTLIKEGQVEEILKKESYYIPYSELNHHLKNCKIDDYFNMEHSEILIESNIDGYTTYIKIDKIHDKGEKGIWIYYRKYNTETCDYGVYGDVLDTIDQPLILFDKQFTIMDQR